MRGGGLLSKQSNRFCATTRPRRDDDAQSRGGEEAFGTRGDGTTTRGSRDSCNGGPGGAGREITTGCPRACGVAGENTGWGAAGWGRAGEWSGGIAGNVALQPIMNTWIFGMPVPDCMYEKAVTFPRMSSSFSEAHDRSQVAAASSPSNPLPRPAPASPRPSDKVRAHASSRSRSAVPSSLPSGDFSRF